MSKFNDPVNNPRGFPYYCVIGQPIDHSLSPDIHQAFANALGIDLHYERIEVSPAELCTDLAAFADAGGRGMNVTVPLKEVVAQAAQELRPRAELAGAANTLIFNSEGDYVADNTDGVGLVNDLTKNLGITLAGKNILMIGAGGAIRGVLAPIVESSPSSITIVNRTFDKARELVKRFSNLAIKNKVSIKAYSYPELPDEQFDVIINGTSLGLSGEVPPIAKSTIHVGTFVYDMVYNKLGKTDFTEWGLLQGARGASDGLGMLVEQAAEAFWLWHGVRPDTLPVLRALRAVD